MFEKFFGKKIEGREYNPILNKNDIESIKEKHEHSSMENRLSEQESLLYQEYASNLERKKFSEKPSETSCKEADELLGTLKAREISVSGVDFKKINLRDISGYKSAEKRLSIAAKRIMSARSDTGSKQFIDKYKGFVLPFVLSTAILLSSCESGLAAEQREVSGDNKSGIKTHERSEDKTKTEEIIKSPSFIGEHYVKEWIERKKLEGIEFKSVKIYVNTITPEIKTKSGETYEGVIKKVEIIVTLRNGRQQRLHGESEISEQYSIEDFPREIKIFDQAEKIIKKTTGKTVELSTAKPLLHWHAQVDAIKKALASFEKQ